MSKYGDELRAQSRNPGPQPCSNLVMFKIAVRAVTDALEGAGLEVSSLNVSVLSDPETDVTHVKFQIVTGEQNASSTRHLQPADLLRDAGEIYSALKDHVMSALDLK